MDFDNLITGAIEEEQTRVAEAEAARRAEEARQIREAREAKHRAEREARYAEQARRREAEAAAAAAGSEQPTAAVGGGHDTNDGELPPPEPSAAVAPDGANENVPPVEPKPLEAVLPGGYLQKVLAEEQPKIWGAPPPVDAETQARFLEDLKDTKNAVDVRTGKTYLQMQQEREYQADYLRGGAEALREYFTSTEPLKNAARFPARVMVGAAEGVVAIPTLVAVGADTLLKKTVGSDIAEPFVQKGLKALQVLEDLKKNELAYQAGGVKLDGAPLMVMSTLEMFTEVLATRGVTTLAKNAIKPAAKQVVKQTVKQTAKRVVSEIEERAIKETAKELGEKAAQVATKESVQEAAEVYTKHLTKEQLKDATKRAAKELVKPDYYRVSLSARNGLETYEAYRKAGYDEGTATMMMLGDSATTYTLLGISNAAGSYSGIWTKSGYQSRMMRLLANDTPANLYLSMEVGAAATKILAAGAAQGSTTYAHLKTLQGALGKEELSDEMIAQTAFTNALFGMAISAGTTLPMVRQAYMADKQAQLFSAQKNAAPRGEWVNAGGRQQIRQDLLPHGGQQGWRSVVPNTGGGTPPANAPVAVHASGEILFADGMRYRPLTNDFVTMSGMVVAPTGEVLTFTPDLKLTADSGQRTANSEQQTADSGQPIVAQTEQGDLFGGEVAPKVDQTALSLFDLMRNGETRTVEVPVNTLKVNDRIVQFKRDADAATGVVEGEQLQGEYQTLPPKPIVVLEYQDGSMEVVTGRHRLDLAKRNGRETIPAAIIREVDGWTPEKARTLDALDNILDEKGDDRDFIAFFRDSGIDRDTAEAKGLIARRKGRNAYAVAMQGETELIDAVMNGDVAADRAAAIAREAPKGEAHAPTVQRAVLKACLERPMTADDAGIMARSLMAGLEKQGDAQLPQQGDLFGADDSALLMAEAEARYAAGKRREALQAVQRLNAALSKGDALSLKGEFAQQLGITDTTDKVQIKQAIAVLKERALRWENYFTDPALYQEAHEAAVRQMAEVTPLFEQANGSFVASPVNGKTPASEETLPEELLDISSKPMPDVTKVNTQAYTWTGLSIAVDVPKTKIVTTAQRMGRDVRVDVYDMALKDVDAQPNAVVNEGRHYLIWDGIRHQITKKGLKHGLDRRLGLNSEIAAQIGSVGNATIEVPGDFGAAHYRIGAVNTERDGLKFVLLCFQDEGGIRNITDVRILKSVNTKGGTPSPTLTSPGSTSSAITVAHLKQAWEEVFVPGLLKHRPELKQQLLASVSKQEALDAPVRPYGEGKGVAADGTPVVAGERLVLGGAYPYGGRTMPLGGAPDSPAMQKGLVKLSTFDLVSIYRDLSGGHVPKVVTKGMRNALGRYWLGKNLIELRSQIFGLADASDLSAIRSKLHEVGFYRHWDQEWREQQRAKVKTEREFKKLVDDEELRSEREMEKHLKKLVDLRVRNRVSDGAGVRVMAHELWHMIDDQDGGINGRGNILGHLAVLKGHLKRTLDGYASEKEYRDEARAFIEWWRGCGPNDVAYFMDSPEMIAEMGGAWFVDPASVAERAPYWSQALKQCLELHPEARAAYDRAVQAMAYGNSSIGRTLSGSWTPEYAQALYRIQEEAAKINNPDSLARSIVFYAWDKRATMVNELKLKLKGHLAAIRPYVSKADYQKELEKAKQAIQRAEKAKMDYTRGAPNHARLFLVDVQGVIGSAFKAVDPNPDVAWQKVALFAHLNRVRGSVRGRATAYGVDAPTARKELVEMTKREGYAGMRKIVKAAQAFHAVYERSIIEHPAFKETFGDNFYDLCKKNTDYVTFKHTFTPEELEQIKISLASAEPGKALEMIGERLKRLERGGGISGASWTKQLVGSFQATLDPLQETIKTAVGILNCIEYNRVIGEFAQLFQNTNGLSKVHVYEAGKAIIPKGYDSLPFMRNGTRYTLVAPRLVVAGFKPDGEASGLKLLNGVSRAMTHYLTTALPSFIAPAFIRDIAAVRLNTPGLDYSKPGQLLPPAVGHLALATWGALGKARWAQALSEVPGFNLIFNEKSLAYWLPIARETGRMVQTGRFAEALEEAERARARGDIRRADLLEYSVSMARHALGDSIFLHYANTTRTSYEKTDWERLQRRYNMRFGSTSKQMQDFARALLQLPGNDGEALTAGQVQAAINALAKGVNNRIPAANMKGVNNRTAQRIATGLNVARQGLRPVAAFSRLINKVADKSSETAELLANTVKLAAFMSLHHRALGKRGYSEKDAEGIALKTIYDAGDPANENRGAGAAIVEACWRAFANVALKCAVRPLRIALGNPIASLLMGDKSGAQQQTREGVELGVKFGVGLARHMAWTVGLSALAGALVKGCAEEDESEEETRKRLEQHPILGPTLEAAEAMRHAQRSSTRYMRENYMIFPIQNFKGANGTGSSLVLTVPIDDDLKPAWLLVNAALDAAGSDEAIPGSGMHRVGGYFDGLFGFDNNQTPLSTAMKLIGLIGASDNPTNSFTGEHFFSDAASVDKTTAVAEFVKYAWNLTPGRISALFDTRPDRLPEQPESEVVAVTEAVRKYTPFFGDAFGRFVRIQRYGRTEAVKIEKQEVEDHRRELRIKATLLAERALKSDVLNKQEINDFFNSLTPEDYDVAVKAYEEGLINPIQTGQQKREKEYDESMEYIFKHAPERWEELIRQE